MIRCKTDDSKLCMVRPCHRNEAGFAALVCSNLRRGIPPFDPPVAACGSKRKPGRFPYLPTSFVPLVPLIGEMPMSESHLSASERRPERRHRVHKVDTRWDPIEFASLVASARAAGLTRGGYIRALVLGSAGPRARRSPSIELEGLAQATAALNKAGSNLNQIARVLNAGGSISLAHSSFAALTETRTAVVRILDIVWPSRPPMIAKGNTHSGARLARYIITGKEGEFAELWELRGFALRDIVDAFRSVHVTAGKSQCKQPFFHVQVRNPEGETLTRSQWKMAVEKIEGMLGLGEQPRAIAVHTDRDTGHEHVHIAWSRIDPETLHAKALPSSSFASRRPAATLSRHSN